MTRALILCIMCGVAFIGAFMTGIFVWHGPNDSPPEWFWYFLALCCALATVFGIIHLYAWLTGELDD